MLLYILFLTLLMYLFLKNDTESIYFVRISTTTQECKIHTKTPVVVTLFCERYVFKEIYKYKRIK